VLHVVEYAMTPYECKTCPTTRWSWWARHDKSGTAGRSTGVSRGGAARPRCRAAGI